MCDNATPGLQSINTHPIQFLNNECFESGNGATCKAPLKLLANHSHSLQQTVCNISYSLIGSTGIPIAYCLRSWYSLQGTHGLWSLLVLGGVCGKLWLYPYCRFELHGDYFTVTREAHNHISMHTSNSMTSVGLNRGVPESVGASRFFI